MIRAFSKGLDPAALKRTQSMQHSEKIIISDICPGATTAGGSGYKQSAAAVSNYGDFLCLQITGSFETLQDIAFGSTPDVVDTGIDYLSGQMVDGVGQRKLFTDYIPFHLFLTPGRRKSATALNAYEPDGVVITADKSNQLFYPEEFEYCFSNSSQIILNVRNTSYVPLAYDIVFHGIRILNRQAVSNLPPR